MNTTTKNMGDIRVVEFTQFSYHEIFKFVVNIYFLIMSMTGKTVLLKVIIC